MKQYPPFLLLSYLVAFIFEFIANTIGDGKLFQNPGWPIFFLVWYGALYSLTFFVFHKKPLWMPVLTWVILGPLLELIFFQRLNIIVDPLIYAVMFFIPFWLYRNILMKSKE